LLATAILLAGLAMLLWKTGGSAFSPGKLSAKNRDGVTIEGFVSHADFQAHCGRCHQPFKSAQGTLCLSCHERVAAQILHKDGTHSLIKNVQQCFTCHSDHQGKDFDPTKAAYAVFNHSATRFSLLHHQVNYDTSPMACTACHLEDMGFTFSDINCALCHGKADPAFVVRHSQDYGSDCAGCHDGQDRMVNFDHQTTSFHLEGKHTQVSCAGCHVLPISNAGRGGSGTSTSLFAGAPKDCAGCHAKDDPHPGMFSKDCQGCHTPVGWSPARWEGASFDHAIQAGFALAHHQQDFDGNPLSCNDCHRGKAQILDLESCVSCHSLGQERAAFMTQHQEQYGRDCTSCHDGVDRMTGFKHETVFPLEGRHAEISCHDCHAGFAFAGTPKACVQCHAEPSIHAGFFGLDCQYCHTTKAWTPAPLQLHRFPLSHGGQGEIACQICHPNNYAEYTCYGCHDHPPEEIKLSHQKEGISLEDLSACARCHPTGLKTVD